MKRLRGVFAALMVLLIAHAIAFCAPARAEQMTLLSQRTRVLLGSGETVIRFQAPSNNVYAFQSFGGEGARAVLLREGDAEPVAEGEGFDFTARLVDGRTYELRVSGESGAAYVEIMRDALGRSFERALEIKNLSAGYNKVIARAYDVHWYRFTPERTGQYMIATHSNMNTEGVLLDAAGSEVDAKQDAFQHMQGNFHLQAQLIQGRTYFLRVCARDDATGKYQLRFVSASNGGEIPSAVRLTPNRLELAEGERQKLSASVQPEGALDELIWLSSDASVARVSATGVVTGVSEGEADVVAIGFGPVSAVCRVVVSRVPVESIAFAEKEISVPVGELMPLRYAIAPEDARDARVRFEVSNEDVLSVDAQGNARGISEGSAQVRVVSVSGGVSAVTTVRVVPTPPKRRALVIGQQRYWDEDIRVGSVNTTLGMAEMLRAQSFSGYAYEVTMRMDSSRDETIAHIREAFKDAQPKDVSLFYINCHGKYVGGNAYLKFFDGSMLSAQALESELRKIPGKVVVMIDCCNSGCFVSKGESRKFALRVTGVFGGGPFAMSKYSVLCSSSTLQNSYRVGSGTSRRESSMATAFGRALCEAGGWNLLTDRQISMRGDANGDNKVTLQEAYSYVLRGAKGLLSEAADTQDAMIYPAGSQFVLFERP